MVAPVPVLQPEDHPRDAAGNYCTRDIQFATFLKATLPARYRGHVVVRRPICVFMFALTDAEVDAQWATFNGGAAVNVQLILDTYDKLKRASHV